MDSSQYLAQVSFLKVETRCMQNLGHLAMEILFLFKLKNYEIFQMSYYEKIFLVATIWGWDRISMETGLQMFSIYQMFMNFAYCLGKLVKFWLWHWAYQHRLYVLRVLHFFIMHYSEGNKSICLNVICFWFAIKF